jgi:NAD(P)-dependent dehydrogenase (short-subunit alcohol dehydrogenase family)
VDFAGKAVIVSGGAGGIGSVTAERFAAEGAAVLVVDRDADGAEAVSAAIRQRGGKAFACAADLRYDDAVAHVADTAIATLGAADVLANIAGFFPGDEPALHESTRRQWDLTVGVNLRGAVALCARVLPHMMSAGSGAIVNVSSTQARAADVAWASYGIAKAGVESLTRYVATQYGPHGVRCNCVAPGLTETSNAMARLPRRTAEAIRQQTPLGRLGHPAELAEAVLFLASDRASFITGQVLAVDGGMTCHMPTLA